MARAADVVEGESPPSPAAPNHGPVEARSLSSITSIASNPPTYPRNPAQKKLEPLVLYIVRVPGSKDVFLSPLKPPTKSSVSAEAINASLYYLHVATPDDDILLQEFEQEREELERLRREGLIDDPDMPLSTHELARLNNVRRKPVPGDKGKADVDISPPLPSCPRPTSSQPQLEGSHILQLDPVVSPPTLPPRPTFSDTSSPAEAFSQLTTSSRENFLDPPPPYESRPPIPSRPLPSPPRDESLGDNRARAQMTTKRWSALSGYPSELGQIGGKERYFESLSGGRHSLDTPQPQLRPRSAHDNPSYGPLRSPARSPARSPGQSPNRRPCESAPPHPPGFHITLIRRDPTHGSQWNVATMSTPKMDDGGIDIDISTPGYNRFLTHNEPLSLESLGVNLPPEVRNRLPKLEASSTSGDSSQPRNPSQPRRFHRKLFVSRPNHPDESRNSLDLSSNRTSIDNGPGSPLKSHFNSKLKSGYYTFNSPWNGTCTFSTSVNGRSLKCKHMIPTPGFPTSTSEDTNPAVTVAEIRFNTPFQAGHLHHHPGSSHISPFTLSQTPIFKDSSSIDPSAPFPAPSTSNAHNANIHHHHPPSSSSKRAAFAHFFNANSRFSHHGASLTRKPSTSSASSGDQDPHDRRGSNQRLLRRPLSDDRLDLSLAREPAGGGMRGKSAKLGKLIIEDEGIKMLDLVVAACMAVWWRGYYY